MLKLHSRGRSVGLLTRAAWVIASGSMLAAGVVRAEKAESVVVTNAVTIANPVTSVKVANATPIPVSVSPGVPFQAWFNLASDDASNQTATRTITVPPNKRLVLQFASVYLYNGSRGALTVGALPGSSGPHVYIAVPQPTTCPGPVVCLSANQSLLLFADPGSTVYVEAFYESSPYANTGEISLSGYLVDP
jgi:hypothetical protein